MKDSSASSVGVRQLSALIKASLWQTPVDCQPFNEERADWDEIGRLAMQQTVGGLALNGALKLPPELLPPREWLLKAYSFLERNRLTHRLLDSTAAAACARLTDAGIRPVLLKGQAYAQAYPDPTLRQCGDIDLYVGEENYRKAYMASLDFGWESEEEFISGAKHYGCFLNGVEIELHRIAGQLPWGAADRRFQVWSRRMLLSGKDSIHIGGGEVEVPPPLFSVIFVFLHLYHHFINAGIGLRQVCDWTMLLHAYCRQLDVEELEKRLKEFGLLRGWQCFTPVAVSFLGLPEEECPLYAPEYSKEAEAILSFVINEGNFGRARRKTSQRPKGYLAGKVHSLSLTTARFRCKFAIDPAMVLRYYRSFFAKGLKRVVSDIVSRK